VRPVRATKFGMWNLEGRTAVITGAGHGIGRATAEAFATAGARVLAADIDETAVAETSLQITKGGGTAVFFAADLSRASSAQQMIDLACESFGSIDILFANAAIQLVRPAADMSEADWDWIMGVNLKAVFLSCRAALKSMKAARRGSIIIAASGHAFATYQGFSAYAASKGGAVAFMRGVALDYAEDGIRANCVIPGATDTRMLQTYFEESSDPAAARAEMANAIPLKRLAAPTDVAKAVLFLASDHASYITGTCLAVDGGLMAHG
jgi:NAD(P)-dependent dehydrogenase (short-subunit alcohol dehydrogenase family)